MANQPLNSGDQGKLLIFTLLMAPSVVFLVGAIPAIFLAFGLFMMKKNQDFTNIEAAVKNFKGYTWLALIGCLISALYWTNVHFNGDQTSWYNDRSAEIGLSMTFAAIAFAYLVLVQVLFFNPLKSHSEWVAVNGIFSSKPKSAMQSSPEPEMDIIKGERLKQYSVADELIKWGKLKEDGYISEEEFNEARKKLLKRN